MAKENERKVTVECLVETYEPIPLDFIEVQGDDCVVFTYAVCDLGGYKERVIVDVSPTKDKGYYDKYRGSARQNRDVLQRLGIKSIYSYPLVASDERKIGGDIEGDQPEYLDLKTTNLTILQQFTSA